MLLFNMTANVGCKSINKPTDVKLVLSLLNSYARKENIAPLVLSLIVSDEYINRIKLFQTKVMKMAKPDGIVIANLGTFKALVKYLKNCYTLTSITKPADGGLTWEAEGQEGGIYHSRGFHVPSAASGLTIGRGYDMKDKTATQIKNDLVKSGIDGKTALVISVAAGKKGTSAKQFLIDNDLLDFEISASCQLKLFNIIYGQLEENVQSICRKSDTVLAYGKVDWNKLNKGIKTVLVDLRYRGDYTTSSRKVIQQYVSDNDLMNFKKAINNSNNWVGVPNLRQIKRINYLATTPV